MQTRNEPIHELLAEAGVAGARLIKWLFLIIRWSARRPVVLLVSSAVAYAVIVGFGVAVMLLFGAACAVTLAWAVISPATFRKGISEPLARRWRGWWIYRRRWSAVARQCGLTIRGVSEPLVPRLGRLHNDPGVDRMLLTLVPGQTPEDVDRATVALAHAFGARACQAVLDTPGAVWLEFSRGDGLRDPVPPLTPPTLPDLENVPVGIAEGGETWTVRLLGTHVLIAGVTGSGKGSVLWSLIRGIAPSITEQRVEVWAFDPKGGMELGIGRDLFKYLETGDPEAIAERLESAVKVMQVRCESLSHCGQRQHEPVAGYPMILILIDEVASLTAYLPDRKLRDRISKALSLLLTQGRAAGVNVVAALQDPRKEVLSQRNLFPTKIALRLDEAHQVDMVLGDGARAAGARCDEIPDSLPGVGYVRVDGRREPRRVRASYLDDEDVRELAAYYGRRPSGSREVVL